MNPKRIVALALVALAVLGVAGQNAAATDTPENRRAAAQRYLDVVSVREFLDNMIGQMSQRVPADKREKFTVAMKQLVPADTVSALMRDGLAKHFTVSELDALSGFYGSPEGKSIMRKMGIYMGEVMPRVHEEIYRAANQIQL
jgi:hypothetical protein